MSAGQVIGTAAAVVGVGFAGAVGWKIFESARTANQLNTAARDIRAAGGDQTALDNLLAALRSEGVLSPGREGAAVSQGTNAETQTQSAGVLVEAERAMLAAGTGAALSPNLKVVRPKDVYANWSIGEGAWLPGQGRKAGWREGPTTVVRGLDMNAYALVLLDDVYPPPAGPWRIVAGDGPTVTAAFSEKNKNRKYRLNLGGGPRFYDIFVTSTDQQGGLVAFWDKDAARFLTPAEAQRVNFCVKNIDGLVYAINADIRLETAFIGEMCKSLGRHTRFQPFPPAVRQQQQARRDATAARIRAKAGA